MRKDEDIIDYLCKVFYCPSAHSNSKLLNSDTEPWCQLLAYFDETWFASCPLEVTKKRVLDRHISTGKSEDVARDRVQNNDGPNAELVNTTAKQADIIVDMCTPLT